MMGTNRSQVEPTTWLQHNAANEAARAEGGDTPLDEAVLNVARDEALVLIQGIAARVGGHASLPPVRALQSMLTIAATCDTWAERRGAVAGILWFCPALSSVTVTPVLERLRRLASLPDYQR